MRITNSMMTNTMLRNLNNSLNRMDKVQQQMATGKRIQRPSDDPVAMAKILTLSSDISASEQYKKNVDDALSWMATTEIAVTQIQDVIQRVRELTVRGATGSLADSDREAIQKEISQLKEQIVAIGNSSYAGAYIFSGYKTTEQPFRIEETPVGQKLTYNGHMLSPGGMVSGGTDDIDFMNFLTKAVNKELTAAQARDVMRVEVGMGSLVDVNINGLDLFQQGFGGVFESLTKLENVLQGKADYKQGFVDMKHQVEIDGLSVDLNALDNNAGDAFITIKMGNDLFTVNFPKTESPNTLSLAQIQKAIDGVEHLKKSGVTIDADGNIMADRDFEVVDTSFGTITTPASGQVFKPLLIGDRLEGTIEVTDGDIFQINGIPIQLVDTGTKKYDVNSWSGKNQLLQDMQAALKNAGIEDIEVSFTTDNRLQFKGMYRKAADDTDAFNDIAISEDGTLKFGFTNGQLSQKAVVKEEKIDTSGMLADLDKNMDNILAKLSEIGAKTNRLELDQNRLDDNILNYKTLRSKVEDVDMAEAIMNFSMEENVYRAALSTGARIIQPTLIDFLR
ncbi:MAG: flagellar hook-associated protein FlgL [Thermotaleaceae bacterium]